MTASELIDRARLLARQADGSVADVRCCIDDYVDAGLQGDACKFIVSDHWRGEQRQAALLMPDDRVLPGDLEFASTAPTTKMGTPAALRGFFAKTDMTHLGNAIADMIDREVPEGGTPYHELLSGALVMLKHAARIRAGRT